MMIGLLQKIQSLHEFVHASYNSSDRPSIQKAPAGRMKYLYLDTLVTLQMYEKKFELNNSFRL